MKEIITKVYSYEELPKEIQKKVISDNYNIHIMYDWWDNRIDDAKTINLQLVDFDLNRGTIDLQFIDSPETTERLILDNHGALTSTYGNARRFQQHQDEDIFLQDLKVSYLDLLQKDFDYLTSDEAIKETIKSNEYTFTIEGKMMYY